MKEGCDSPWKGLPPKAKIDIKPYSSEIDAVEGVNVGWMKKE